MNLFLDGLLGLAVGDALGVPYEFRTRQQMQESPAKGMTGHGTHNQEKGTWSDDTSMALCCADSLCRGFDLADMMKKFSAWKNHRRYTALGVVFDIGLTCRKAIERFDLGLEAESCGARGETANGNGALMRIFPVSLWRVLSAAEQTMTDAELLKPVHACSALTHAHERGMICCGMYTLFLDEWIKREPQDSALSTAARAYARAQRAYCELGGVFREEIESGRFMEPEQLAALGPEKIASSGYVLDTFHAALWSLLTTADYASCVLRAVNLGGDTDTTAAVAGSLAGIVYGRAGILQSWLDELKNRELIESIAKKLHESVYGKPQSTEIAQFEGEHAHLALKYGAEVELDGIVYDNAYAAWMAQRTHAEHRTQFAGLNAHRARRLSKQLPVREGWQEAELDALYAVCKAKYAQNLQLRAWLLATGNRPIVYDTTGAHDNRLGRCLCAACKEAPYENRLGNILMRVRAELAAGTAE
ncbi:MAG: DUF1768 domain-containing protein [Clostridia bacterium]|nr:DUF1768 domain-containing protein [Clostridia bacterium]